MHVFTTHLCSTHYQPADVSPNITLQALIARKIQCEEIATFAKEVLEYTYDQKNDLALVTGDFNILRNPLCEEFQKKLIKSNQDFEKCIPKLGEEYNNSLLKSFQEVFKTSEIKLNLENQLDKCFPE